MKTRFKNKNEKIAYDFIYNEIKNMINENSNFSVSNIAIKNRLRVLDESSKYTIVVNAIFDAIGFSNKNLKKTTMINESLLSSRRNVNLYNSIFESVKLHRKTKKNVDSFIDEGLIAGALGALAGISFGPAIGKAICNALGIGKGVLYDLMTSKLVNAAVCGKLGLRF